MNFRSHGIDAIPATKVVVAIDISNSVKYSIIMTVDNANCIPSEK